jgi:glycosyltransferase 2 family protein
MNKRFRTILQYGFFLGLGIFLVWWSVRDLNSDNRSQIRTAIQNARYILVLPVFIILLLSHYVRGLRWRLLIAPMGYHPSARNAFFAVLIGYLTNQAVPRLGEAVKCTVLGRYENIPVDKLIGTILLERLIDAFTLLMVFGITLAIQPGLYSQIMDTFFNKDGATGSNSISGLIILLVLVALIVAAALLWMIIKKKNFDDLKKMITGVVKSGWQGFTAIRHLKKRGQFIFLSITMWTLYLFAGYIGFKALQETEQYGVREAFTILSAGSIGMIVPTPGGIGAYAYLVSKTMQLYGVEGGVALAFGWILWLVQTSVVVVGGLFSFIAMPVLNKNKKEAHLVFHEEEKS